MVYLFRVDWHGKHEMTALEECEATENARHGGGHAVRLVKEFGKFGIIGRRFVRVTPPVGRARPVADGANDFALGNLGKQLVGR